MKKQVSLLIAFLLVLMLPCAAWAKIPDAPTENIFATDFTGTLRADDLAWIEFYGEALEDACGVQCVAVAVDFFDGKSAEEYAYDLFNTWGIGDEKTNTGILFLLGTGAREYFVEIGTGMKSVMKTSEMLDVIDQTAWDYFADSDFSTGMREGYIALAEAVAEKYNVVLNIPENDSAYETDFGAENIVNTPQPDQKEGGGSKVAVFLIVIIVLLIVLSVGRKATKKRYVFFGPTITPRPPRTSPAPRVQRGPAPVRGPAPTRSPAPTRGPAPMRGPSPLGGNTTSRGPAPTSGSSSARSFGGGHTSGTSSSSSFGSRTSGSSGLFGNGRSSSVSRSPLSSTRSSASRTTSSRSSGSGRSFGGGGSRGTGGGRKF